MTCGRWGKGRAYVNEGEVWYEGFDFSDDLGFGGRVEGLELDVEDGLFLGLLLYQV
jgi:hypothetical protein